MGIDEGRGMGGGTGSAIGDGRIGDAGTADAPATRVSEKLAVGAGLSGFGVMGGAAALAALTGEVMRLLRPRRPVGCANSAPGCRVDRRGDWGTVPRC
jgi:hypothetical protein